MAKKKTKPAKTNSVSSCLSMMSSQHFEDNVSLSNQLICFFDDCTKFPSLSHFIMNIHTSRFENIVANIIFPKQNVDADHFYAADFFINNYQRLVFLSIASFFVVAFLLLFSFSFIFSMFFFYVSRSPVRS